MAINHSGFSSVPQFVSGPISISIPITVGAVAAVNVTVKGATPGQHILCFATGLADTSFVASAECTAANQVTVKFWQNGGWDLTPVIAYFMGL